MHSKRRSQPSNNKNIYNKDSLLKVLNDESIPLTQRWELLSMFLDLKPTDNILIEIKSIDDILLNIKDYRLLTPTYYRNQFINSSLETQFILFERILEFLKTFTTGKFSWYVPTANNNISREDWELFRNSTAQKHSILKLPFSNSTEMEEIIKKINGIEQGSVLIKTFFKNTFEVFSLYLSFLFNPNVLLAFLDNMRADPEIKKNNSLLINWRATIHRYLEVSKQDILNEISKDFNESVEPEIIYTKTVEKDNAHLINQSIEKERNQYPIYPNSNTYYALPPKYFGSPAVPQIDGNWYSPWNPAPLIPTNNRIPEHSSHITYEAFNLNSSYYPPIHTRNISPQSFRPNLNPAFQPPLNLSLPDITYPTSSNPYDVFPTKRKSSIIEEELGNHQPLLKKTRQGNQPHLNSSFSLNLGSQNNPIHIDESLLEIDGNILEVKEVNPFETKNQNANDKPLNAEKFFPTNFSFFGATSEPVSPSPVEPDLSEPDPKQALKDLILGLTAEPESPSPTEPDLPESDLQQALFDLVYSHDLYNQSLNKS